MHDERWIRRYAPATGPRLVCFPHAGGSASFFRPVAAALAPAIDVLAVQLPGRQDRRGEPPIRSIPELAGLLTDVIRPLTDRPFTLFGHSMGAILAYEVGLRLWERDGIAPVRLFASGRRAPACYRDERVHQRDDAGVLAELRALGRTERAVLDDPEVVDMIMPAIRADYQAIETYRHRPGAALTAPVTVLVGDRDERTTLAEAGAWAGHTTGAFELLVYPGGHFFLLSRAAEVIDLLADRLAPVG